MRIKSVFAVIAVFTSFFSLTGVAKAGEGAIAASAAFSLSDGKVTGVAVSAAVGKNDAIATANNRNVSGNVANTATAQGSAARILTTINAEYSTVDRIEGTGDNNLGQSQGNELTAPLTVNLGTLPSGNVIEVKTP